MNHIDDSTFFDESLPDLVTDSLVSLELPSVLEEVAAHAASLPGRLKVLQAVPATDRTRIRTQLDLVAELRETTATDGPLGLHGLIPMEGILTRLENPLVIFEAEDILAVADLAGTAEAIRGRLRNLGARFVLLAEIADGLPRLGHIRDRVAEVIDEHGLVRSSASPGLTRIRERERSTRRRVQHILESVVQDRDLSRVVQEDYVTLRNDRYVILLKPEFKGLLDGIVHDHSRSGASVYVEPLEVVELNNQVASLMDEDREEIRRIFKELTAELRAELPELTSTYERLVWLDAFQARALYAAHTDSTAPELVEEGFRILGARHPLLLAAGLPEVVPMDVVQEASTLVTVISGANMGGKTVALKIAGLFPLMTRCGIMLPAREGTQIRPFARIMADIGDEQDIRGHVSSFSGHMGRIKSILDTAAKGDLVLLDELGSATDPAEGSALAMGIMDELMLRNVSVLVTTHLTHLKAYALGRADAKNVSAEFHPETLKPTFRLLYDLPGESHAILTAERIGVPRRVIEAARRYIDKDAGGSSALIQALRERMGDVEQTRSELEQQRHDLESELAGIRAAREELVEGFRKEAQELMARARKEIGDLQKALKTGRLRERSRVQDDLKRIKDEISTKLGTPLEKPASVLPVGTRVKVKTLGKTGIVDSLLDRGQLEVSVGSMKIRAEPDDVIVLDRGPDKKNASKSRQIAVDIPVTTPRWEVNVIGLRVEEALPVVDRALDEALLGGLSTLNIIHGKGTGRLRQAIWDHLSGHALVRGLQAGDLRRGGHGVTVVELRSD
jgi:DNA mismatch repair protein MutS2